MPEEINRIVADVLADMLWAPSRDAVENLVSEGISPNRIRLVGNIMIDSLEMLRAKIESQMTYLSFGLDAGRYGVVTLHRPSNVDDPAALKLLCGVIEDIARSIPLVFPLHPRTRKTMVESGLLNSLTRCRTLLLPEPLSYVPFISLVLSSRFVITDSGGLQEETTYLGVPCLTVRRNTERPITLTHGTNQLCDWTTRKEKAEAALRRPAGEAREIELWDGQTAPRIVSLLREFNDRSGQGDVSAARRPLTRRQT